jgi:hypothetical protein
MSSEDRSAIRRSGRSRLARGAVRVLLCLSALLLVLYILLAAGLLGEMPGMLVGALSSSGGTTVEFRGLRTDLFWNTSVDTVLVTAPDGLTVLVGFASIHGSGLDYLVNRHVREVRVRTLEIALSQGPEDTLPPQSVEAVLDVIDASIPTSADLLTLDYGRIIDGSATVVDSMHLETSVDRGSGVELNVDSVRVHLPGFGLIEARGDLALAACTVSTGRFEVTVPVGSVTLNGSMSGPGSSLEATFTGSAGSSFTRLPVDITASFGGTVSGPLSSLQADLSFHGGDAVLFGREATIDADTVAVGMDGVVIRGLRLSNSTTFLELDADLDWATMVWSSLLHLSFDGTDLSGCMEGFPWSALAGTMTLEGSGEGDSLVGGSVTLALDSSYISAIRVDRLDLSADISLGEFHAEGETLVEDDRVSFSIDGSLGDGFLPDEVSFRAEADMASSALAEKLGIEGMPDISGARLALDGSGSGFQYGLLPSDWQVHASAMTGSVSGLAALGLNGIDRLGSTSVILDASGTSDEEGAPAIGSLTVHIETSARSVSTSELLRSDGVPDLEGLSLSFDGRGDRFSAGLMPDSWTAALSADASSLGSTGMSGIAGLDAVEGVSISASGSGTRFSAMVEGSISADSVSMGSFAAESTVVQGSLRIAAGNVSASGSLAADSLSLFSKAFRLSAVFDLEGSELTLDTLRLNAADGSFYSAWLSMDLGPVTRFAAGDITATHSKHRLISGGGLSGYADDGVLVLDTLWVNPPVGTLGASGFMDRDAMSFAVDIDGVDLTSLRTLIGLPEEMSGVASFIISLERSGSDVEGSLTGTVRNPAYGYFRMDSLTVAVRSVGDSITVDGIYAWRDGVRSGLQMTASGMWSSEGFQLSDIVIDWMELEVNSLGDWLFYVLPLPFRTIGASVSARVEYSLLDGEPALQIQASARIDRLFITLLGIELPKVNFFLNYPDSSHAGYNTRLTLGAGDSETGNFSSTFLADIDDFYPLHVGQYLLNAEMNSMEVPIPGMGAVIATGSVSTGGTGIGDRPLLSGHLSILEGALGIPQSTGVSHGGSSELPFDMAINVTGARGIWFRTSFADIEVGVKMKIMTIDHMPTVNGSINAIRGRITLYQNEFEIIEGRVELIQGTPPQMNLHVLAHTSIRSLMDHSLYEITVLITGTSDDPEITLAGTGPSGSLTQEDILTLLAVGVTYGEMQQLNSAAIRTEAGNMAQALVASLLARNIRHEIGLDTFELSPELLADTTSLVLNVGKYILPSLYVAYKGDLFSADPGTFSLQYLFSQDFYMEGTTRSTIHGDMEPTLELHYTIRY